MRVWPDGVEEFLLLDDPVAILGEEHKGVEELGLNSEGLAVAKKFTPIWVESKGTELQHFQSSEVNLRRF